MNCDPNCCQMPSDGKADCKNHTRSDVSFWLFLKVQMTLKGKCLEPIQAIESATAAELKTLPKKTLQNYCRKMLEWWDKSVQSERKFYERDFLVMYLTVIYFRTYINIHHILWSYFSVLFHCMLHKETEKWHLNLQSLTLLNFFKEMKLGL